MISYRYVKITAQDGDVFFAYERSIFWFFKRYLDMDSEIETWERHLISPATRTLRVWLVACSLEDAKAHVRKVKENSKNKIPAIKIENAETKLSKALTGDET